MSASAVTDLHVKALLEVISAGTVREEGNESAKQYAKETRSPALRAFFEAWAKHEVRWLTVEEFKMNDRDLGEPVPDGEEGFSDGKVVIGHSPGGDLFAVELQPKGSKAPVWRMAHDEEWAPYEEASSLEAFLKKCAKGAKKDGGRNDFLRALAKVSETPADRQRRAARDAAKVKGTKVAWIQGKAPATKKIQSPAAEAVLERDSSAWVFDASPYPLVFTDAPKGGSRLNLAKGSRLQPLKLPPMDDERVAVSPSGTTAVVGSAVQLYWLDVKTGGTRPLPFLGWVNDVTFIRDDLFVVATADGMQEPTRGSPPIDRLLAKQKDHGGLAYLMSESALHVFTVDAKGSFSCVQQISGEATAVNGFFGRFLIARATSEDTVDRKSAQSWAFVANRQQLVFLSAMHEEPGALTEHAGRVFGAEGYELIKLEEAAARAPATAAGVLPYEVSTDIDDSIAEEPPLRVFPLKLVAAAKKGGKPSDRVRDWESAAAPNGVKLTLPLASDPDAPVALVGGPRGAKPRTVKPEIQGADPECSFNADGSRCLLLIGSPSSRSIWEIDTATAKARLVQEDGTYSGCAYLGEQILFTTPMGSIECVVRKGDGYEDGEDLDVECHRLFSTADGQFVLTGNDTEATYIGAWSRVIQLVDGQPQIVGRLPQGLIRAWEKKGKTFLEASDGATYELNAG